MPAQRPARNALSASPYALDALGTADASLGERLRGQKIFFDGVLKGDYSLAIVNRNLIDALIRRGIDITCHSREPDWHTDRLLGAMPRVRERLRGDYPAARSFDIHLRNTWPPVTEDMVGRINAYVCFAWEESELPPRLVDAFNRDLDLMMVTSNFVRHVFRHSGVTIPVEVVGNGCDHLDTVSAVAASAPPRCGRARILHISSGFRRKGPDLLVESFVNAFRRDDPVELVIKTFPNPDNVIAETIARFADRLRDAAPVQVINASWSNAEIAGLYRSATMMVAPSRGEGFGLPLAEAMMFDLPVVTTDYGGQRDFCRHDTAWLVDYTLAPSCSHVAEASSLWADARIESLSTQMRAVLSDPEGASARCRHAKTFLQKHCTWSKVADRVLRALARTSSSDLRATVQENWSIELVSAWRQQCGIATYAEHLFAATSLAPRLREVLAKRVVEDALPLAAPEAMRGAAVSRLWGHDSVALMQLARRLEQGNADVLWLQHHPGHFSAADMDAVTAALSRAAYRVTAITLHSVREAMTGGSLRWVSAFDVAFVHDANDAALLSAAGHRNPVVLPHGIVVRKPQPATADSASFTVGSFGFLLPHKNIDTLVLAFAAARRYCPKLRLKLFHAVKATDESRWQRAVVETLIGNLALSDCVSASFNFIPEHELIEQLATCDLLVFPYRSSTETASGAARIALGVDRPILCSRSTPLRDLWRVSHVLKNDHVECLTEALVSLAQSDDLLKAFDRDRRIMIDRNSYERIAVRHVHHLEEMLGGTGDIRKAA